MTDFKVGDKVRLKAKPEIVAYIDSFDVSDGQYYLEREEGDITWRFPEELELEPEPIKVGDWVTWGIRAVDAQVIAIHGGLAWVEWEEGSPAHQLIVCLDELAFVRR